MIHKKKYRKKTDEHEESDIFMAFAQTSSRKKSIINEFDFHETEKIRDWTLVFLTFFIVLICFTRADYLGLVITLRAFPFLRKKWTE